jgi:hypothetical protein
VVVTDPRSRVRLFQTRNELVILHVRIIKARYKLVILDSDLADLYKTTVDAINKTAMRNACMFPRSICFRLSNDEWHHLQRSVQRSDQRSVQRSDQADRGDWLCAPLVFTEEGTLALSKVLGTFDATRGSVFVWRAFRNLQAGQATAKEADEVEAEEATTEG